MQFAPYLSPLSLLLCWSIKIWHLCDKLVYLYEIWIDFIASVSGLTQFPVIKEHKTALDSTSFSMHTYIHDAWISLSDSRQSDIILLLLSHHECIFCQITSWLLCRISFYTHTNCKRMCNLTLDRKSLQLVEYADSRYSLFCIQLLLLLLLTKSPWDFHSSIA